MILNFRLEQEFGLENPIQTLEAMNILRYVTQNFDLMLGTKKNWYEQGTSRKKALQNKIFQEDTPIDKTIERWNKRYKKNYPFFGEGIWDGGNDDESASISLCTSSSSTNRRLYPLGLTIEFSIDPSNLHLTFDKTIVFFKKIININNHCTYQSLESGGYSFPKIIPKENGCQELYKKVFPDRISCGWMLFIPYTVLPELIPEAAKVVPVVDNDARKVQ